MWIELILKILFRLKGFDKIHDWVSQGNSSQRIKFLIWKLLEDRKLWIRIIGWKTQFLVSAACQAGIKTAVPA